MQKELLKLNGNHYNMCVDYVTNGSSNRELAHKFDVHENYIPTIKSSPAWKKEETRLREEILDCHKARVSTFTNKAINTVVEVMDNKRTVYDEEGNEHSIRA